MNSLERALIAKAGNDHGFENVRDSTPERVVLYSARHRSEAHVVPAPVGAGTWRVTFPVGPPAGELSRGLPDEHLGGGVFEVGGEAALGRLLRRAAELAMALPNRAAESFAERVAEEMAMAEGNPPSSTETLALVRRRVGQDVFRKALMDYWGGACAVTGIAVPELLRASHAKPWADCATDAERLNVFNGFLLCAHLDALFDRGLMTFDAEGAALFSERLDAGTIRLLHLDEPLRLRWQSPDHAGFLDWHRTHVFRSGEDRPEFSDPVPIPP